MWRSHYAMSAAEFHREDGAASTTGASAYKGCTAKLATICSKGMRDKVASASRSRPTFEHVGASSGPISTSRAVSGVSSLESTGARKPATTPADDESAESSTIDGSRLCHESERSMLNAAERPRRAVPRERLPLTARKTYDQAVHSPRPRTGFSTIYHELGQSIDLCYRTPYLFPELRARGSTRPSDTVTCRCPATSRRSAVTKAAIPKR